MNLWIINHYAVPPIMPGGTRHFELAKRLVERGWDVTLVASSFHHASRFSEVVDSKRIQVEMIDGVRFVWIPSRSHYRGNGIARVGNMVEFAWRVWWHGRSRFGGRSPQPSVIIGSSPHLLTPWAARRLARKLGSRFVFEVRDLWPETFVALGLLPARHVIVRGLRYLERSLYRSAECIVTLLPNADRYIEGQIGSCEKVVWVANGADLGLLPVKRPPRTDDVLEVVYTGAHGRANVLDDLLSAASILEKDGADKIHITLIGEGPQKQALQSMAEELGLSSITFQAGIPKECVRQVLDGADVAVALLEDSPLYEYGISLNKLFDYMASGTPVLFAGRVEHDYVSLARCGLTVSPQNLEAIAEGLRTLVRQGPAERKAMGDAGRAYLEMHHTWDHLANRLAAVLEGRLDGSAGWERSGRARRQIYVVLKRTVDLVVACSMMVIAVLPLGLVALAIKLHDGGPIFFRQVRVGKGGRLFRVWKFRTMIVDASKQGLGNTVAVDDDRITRVGHFLRNLGMDELPQLINVLAGQMSLVGPRPTLAYQVEHYNDFQRRRLEAKPGITSLAVVSGRNTLSWVERIKLDVWYIDHWSLRLDLSILFRTLWKVLVTREGLYGEDGINDPFVEELNREDEGEAS